MVARSAVTCIFLILFTRYAGQIVNYVQILDDHALVNFPESIEFVLHLQSKSPVETITLIYGTNAASCNPSGARQVQEFDPGTEIELEWEWNLKRSGAVPSGAEIWWQWEVEDEQGGTHLTERQRMRVIDDRHSWQEISEANVTVYWYEGDETFGQSLLAVVLDSLERLRSEAGVASEDPIQVWAYPTAVELRDAVVNTPEWAGGVAFPNYGIAAVAFRPGEDEKEAQVIPHEIAHLVESSVTFNCRGGRMPTWLSEGLAEFSAGGRSASSMTRLEESLEQGLLPPLNLLSRGFSAYARGADLAYTQSTAVATYLIEVYGPEKMSELVDRLHNGSPIDDALIATYGFDTEGLDASWRLSLGYEPLPVSSADLTLQMGEPTQIPTIALAGIPMLATATSPPATQAAAVPSSNPAAPTGTPPVLAPTVPSAPTNTRLSSNTLAVANIEPGPATAVPAVPQPPAQASLWPILLIAGAVGILLILLLVLFYRYRGG